MNNFYKLFQKLLWNSRLVIIVAVLTGILSTFIMIIIGTYEAYEGVVELINIFNNADFSLRSHYIVEHIVNSVDIYLIATVLLIFSIGLYELFIAKLDDDEIKIKRSGVLIIKNLEQLKSKLAQTIIMILIVNFFQKATKISYNNSLELLFLGCSIFLIAIAVYFTHYKE
ncbi:MAG: YqhA family protein [Candidatus Azosocius agrarius]|nr:MAG: YqhA family protein [Gammaproteobacteria bacterium]